MMPCAILVEVLPNCGWTVYGKDVGRMGEKERNQREKGKR